MTELLGGQLRSYRGKSPQIHPTAFIAPGAQLIGDVQVGPQASIWYNCVLRADLAPIVVGARSNVQDGTIVHVEGPRSGQAGNLLPTVIGTDALVGHMAILHGCTIEDGGFVGMGAIVMDGACIGKRAMLGAGALLPPGKRVEEGELWIGRPAHKVRDLHDGEIGAMSNQCGHYVELAENHSASG